MKDILMQKQCKNFLMIKRFNSELLTTIKVDNETQLKSTKEELMTIPVRCLIARLELQNYKEISNENRVI